MPVLPQGWVTSPRKWRRRRAAAASSSSSSKTPRRRRRQQRHRRQNAPTSAFQIYWPRRRRRHRRLRTSTMLSKRRRRRHPVHRFWTRRLWPIWLICTDPLPVGIGSIPEVVIRRRYGHGNQHFHPIKHQVSNSVQFQSTFRATAPFLPPPLFPPPPFPLRSNSIN